MRMLIIFVLISILGTISCSDLPCHVTVQCVGKPQCNGVLINDNHVLTAARCCYNVPFCEVHFHTQKKIEDSKTICRNQVRKINRIHIPIDYEYSKTGLSYGTDLAVLQFQTPATNSECIAQPAVIPSDPLVDHKDTFAVVSGDISADMRIISNEECANLYDGVIKITDNIICAVRADSNDDLLCDIDDGSTLCKINYRTGKLEAIGMAYHGVGDDCKDRRPGLFTRVDRKLNWLANFEVYTNRLAPGDLPVGDLLMSKPLYYQYRKRVVKRYKKKATA